MKQSMMFLVNTHLSLEYDFHYQQLFSCPAGQQNETVPQSQYVRIKQSCNMPVSIKLFTRHSYDLRIYYKAINTRRIMQNERRYNFAQNILFTQHNRYSSVDVLREY